MVEQRVQKNLAIAGQEHVLKFLPELQDKDAHQLVQQCAAFDFTQLNDLLKTTTDKHFKRVPQDTSEESQKLTPPESMGTLSAFSGEDLQNLENAGRQFIAQGKVAALCLGGGMGTRLGLDGPKGLFSPPGLPSKKSLYQLFTERVLNLKRTCGNAYLPLLIMTSPINHKVTVKFFKENDFWGFPEKDVYFFPQGVLPAFTYEGKVILEEKGLVSTSPDGNGGIYPALEKSGVLKKCADDGIEYFHVFGVDNILVRPADPRFIGYCAYKNAELGNKSVLKASPDEKVGVVAMRGGRYCIVEYTELSSAERQMVDKNGELVYSAGNICNHVFTTKFLIEKVLPNMKDNYHVAEKKIKHVELTTGKEVKPDSNNGIKLESFIFDVFPMTRAMAILECKREEEFAPIKNAKGVDSPDSALGMIKNLHRSWVEKAGGEIRGDITVEVSPLVSYAGEGLEEYVKGKVFTEDFSIEKQEENKKGWTCFAVW